MKKIISVFCIALVLFGSCFIVSAESVTDNEYLYEDRFIEEYVKEGTRHTYEEVYYHYGDNEEIKWCLIYATASNLSKEMVVNLKIEDVVISSSSIIYPFKVRYAIYDVENDLFVDFVKDYDNLSKYDGLYDVLRTVDNGVLIGDGNRDGKLSIIDVTIIQRAIANIDDINIKPYSDYRTGKRSNYYDVDEDGEFTVMDATAIQMKLAKVEA